MSDYYAGECNKCGNNIYTDGSGNYRWCYVCDEEPNQRPSKVNQREEPAPIHPSSLTNEE